ncbi:Protein of unknown function [Pyronema omphalodes CBS 100304]|uniref:Uncharacterized protein n=1 Tax=Pyronema omphalodes (strain CBS 100304) TaxID=1076935 RepID=U4L477_PYROM|nr:Protein of unknown function [Pyronema omphalodes CBS 100304]
MDLSGCLLTVFLRELTVTVPTEGAEGTIGIYDPTQCRNEETEGFLCMPTGRTGSDLGYKEIPWSLMTKLASPHGPYRMYRSSLVVYLKKKPNIPYVNRLPSGTPPQYRVTSSTNSPMAPHIWSYARVL